MFFNLKMCFTYIFLFLYSPLGEGSILDDSALVQSGTAEEGSDEEQELLKLYHQNFDDQFVDLNLIMDVLYNICSTTTDGEESVS